MTARTCDHPIAAGQRYCLVCGEACAPPRVDWLTLARTGSFEFEPVPDVPGIRLPAPRTAAALVLGMLGFGVIVGGAAGPASADGQQRQLIVVSWPAPAPAAPAPAAAEPATPADSGTADLSASAPAPTADVPAPTPAPATTPAPSTTKTPAATPVDTPTTVAAPTLPPVKHVWVLALRGAPFADPVAAPYLAGELRQQGTLLTAFSAPADDPLITGAALLSGQTGDKPSYPATVATLADRLTGAGQVWKGYVDAPAPAAGVSLCAPGSPLADRNPLLRFASVQTAAECGSQVAPLDQLARDVVDPGSAPALSYLVPAPEHDGADVAGTDAWARTTVESIRSSKAYADGGLILILGGAAAPGAAAPPGALMVSPYVKAGGTQGVATDVFGLTRTIEDLLALPPLTTAKTKDAEPLGAEQFAAWTPKGS